MSFHSIIKTLKLERERHFQPGKKSSVKILTSTILNDERLKIFLLRLGIRKGYLLSSLLVNILVSTTRPGKEIKDIRVKRNKTVGSMAHMKSPKNL